MTKRNDSIVEWPGGAGAQIVIDDWMTNPDIRAVIDAIEGGGAAIRFVGGCVRDALLQNKIKDVDLATTGRPERIAKLLENAG